MAYNVNEFGRDVAVEGLIIPESRPYITSAVLAANKDSVGGFLVFEKVGEVDKVYPTAVDNSAYAGIVPRSAVRETFKQYDEVNVLRKGSLWVKVKGQVQAGQAAYYTSNLEITATSSNNTAIAGGKFKTNAVDGALAILEIL